MTHMLQMVDAFFASFVPVTDFLWDFPANYTQWASIPILGEFSLVILMLLGGSFYFTFRFGFVQLKEFKNGIRLLANNTHGDVGTSPLSAFLISMAGRVGAGNIVGVTSAITVGGPGAVFWMWLAAFAGMATAFAEGTLAQIFKEKKGDEYVGGLTFYVQKIWKNKVWVGFTLCIMYIIYIMFSVPVHTFNVFTAASSIMNEASGRITDVSEPIYYIIAAILIIVIAVIVFGGIKRVVDVTDKVVPIMAVVYSAIIIVLIVINLNKVPTFFSAVITGAFKPTAIFGGAMGVAISQGLRRGLLSNEAGMGTATHAASIADGNHPCEQGIIQGIGVFTDTIIICTLTGFVVTAGALWENPGVDWETLSSDKIGTFLTSIKELIPGTALDVPLAIFAALCFGFFAFTTLLCDLTYAEVAANKISRKKEFMLFIHVLGALIFVPLGTMTVLAGLTLDNLWYISDFINVVLVLINIPTLFVAQKYVRRAYQNYKTSDGKRFVSADIGIETEVWSREAASVSDAQKEKGR